MSQSLDGLEESPGKRQAMPMMAIGSDWTPAGGLGEGHSFRRVKTSFSFASVYGAVAWGAILSCCRLVLLFSMSSVLEAGVQSCWLEEIQVSGGTDGFKFQKVSISTSYALRND